MKNCHINHQRLQAWFDNQLPEGDEKDTIEQHVEGCASCTERVAAWRAASKHLYEVIDDGVGEVEPLLALQQIRQRITRAQERSIGNRLRVWWQDVWAFNRPAIAGLAVAAALGAMTAPALVFWLGSSSSRGTIADGNPSVASVVVESLEFDGDAKAVVYRPEGESTTTIIWVETDDDDTNQESF